MLADVYLPLKPRSDIALLNGMMHMLIRDGLIDREYIARHTTGFEELKQHVEKFTPEHVAAVTGLAPELIERTALLYGRAKAAFIGWTMGVNHSDAGRRDRERDQQPGADDREHRPRGRRAVLDHRTVQRDGHARSGLRVEPARLPQVRKRGGPRGARGASGTWRPTHSQARGLAYPDIIEAALDKRVRALWIIATNPVVSFPNLGVLKQALETVEFLVVQDGFDPTPTTELAHLVLPAAIWGEKGRHLHQLRAAREQSEQARSTRPAKRAPTSTSFSIWRDGSACATNCFPAGPRRATLSTNGGACRRAASATTRA